MSDSERLHVLVSVGEGYVMPLSVMLSSLLDTNPAAQTTVWLLYRDLSDESRALIATQVENCGAEIEQVKAKDTFFEGYPTATRITKETYLRLLAGELLPGWLHRVLWLDADIIVRSDLRRFYGTDFGDAAVIACPHAEDMTEGMRAYCLGIGLDPARYVNAGVLLINLDAWRALDLRAEATRAMNEAGELKYADQDLLNLIFRDSIGFADSSVFNCRTNRKLPPADWERARAEAAVIHYCGSMKPWMFSDVPLGDCWRDHYRESPFGQRPLRLISSVGLSRFVEKAMKQVMA